MQIDNHFAPDEHLYLRLNPTYFPREYADINEVPLNEVHFPDFSVNRGKYSVPEDVLRPNWPNWGIATFQVKDIPEPLSFQADTFNFKAEHVPEHNNYAHSEVRTYKNGSRNFNQKNIPPKHIRTRFRAILRERLILLRRPIFNN